MDEQSQQENLEEKLKDYVDCLTDKRYPWLLANSYTWGPVQPVTNGTKGSRHPHEPFFTSQRQDPARSSGEPARGPGLPPTSRLFAGAQPHSGRRPGKVP